MPMFTIATDICEPVWVTNRFNVSVEADTEEEAMSLVRNGEFDMANAEYVDHVDDSAIDVPGLDAEFFPEYVVSQEGDEDDEI